MEEKEMQLLYTESVQIFSFHPNIDLTPKKHGILIFSHYHSDNQTYFIHPYP